DQREVLVHLGDGADVVEWLLVLHSCEHLPDRFIGAAHTRIPSSRIVCRAFARSRSLVHTGSHTTSSATSSTAGSASSAWRMSSSMNSIAGHPIAVNVIWRSARRRSGR